MSGTDRARVTATSREALQSAVVSEIESAALGRMEAAGGRVAQLARFRSILGEALGIYGTVKDLIDMAMEGYNALTTQRRMVMRVSSAHGFGYWAFQHANISNPLNPPNSFLILHRKRDEEDRQIGESVGNPNFSSDGGLSSADWNMIWRRGVRNVTGRMQSQLLRMASRGHLQQVLADRFGPAANVHRQSHETIANQYKAVVISPRLGSPTAAAFTFFVASLDGAADLEKDMNMRLYQQFPYRP
ncbi:MAG: hypothetical protein AB8G99_11080 [Planctomycetaceae bacterium]